MKAEYERYPCGERRRGALPQLLGVAFLFVAQSGPASSQSSSPFCEFARLATFDGIAAENFGTAVSLSTNRLVVSATRKNIGGNIPGAVYVYERCGTNWYQEQILAPTTASVFFGTDLDLDGDTLVAGTVFDSTAASLAGSAYVFEYDGFQFNQAAYLLPSVPSSSMGFGTALSLDQDSLFIGAPGDSAVPNSSGSLYVFECIGAVWTEVQIIRPPTSSVNAQFGDSVVAKDGELFVGARFSNVLEGEVFAYSFDGTQWVLQQCIEASNPSVAQSFGIVSFDGSTLVVGAPGSLGPLGGNSGLVVILEKGNDGLWAEVQQILPPSSSTPSLFGQAVCVQGDWLAVGAAFDSTAATLAGAVHLYNKVGSTWIFASTLTALEANVSDQLAGGNNNSGVALDGDIVAAGAPLGDSNVVDAGTAYTWSISGATCKTLAATPATLSLSAGGSQSIQLNAGSGFASALYWIVGSISGTDPGFTFANGRLPINIDDYFQLSLIPGPSNPLVRSMGLLNNMGSTIAHLVVAPASDPSLIGMRLDHAAVVYSLAPLSLDHISNPASLLLAE